MNRLGFAFFASCFACSVALTGCKESEPKKSLPPEVKATPGVDAGARPVLPPIAEAKEIQAFVDAWRVAQNEGSFERYEKFYADKFTGVKRSVDRVIEFGREGWMKDRKAMFEKPFTVTVESVTSSFAPDLAMVTFKQGWRSDTYQDQGNKRLLLVKKDGKLLISREEMLDSRAKDGESPMEISFEQGAVARPTSDGFALLIPGKVDINWAADHPRYVSNNRAERAVAPNALPAGIREKLSAKYEVFDASGARCEVAPKDFVILIDVIPHFGTVQHWEDFEAQYESRPKRPVANEQRAVDLWQMATGPYQGEPVSPGLTLGMRIKPDPKCQKPTWGRKSGEKSPAPWSVLLPNDAEKNQLLAAVPSHSLVKKFDAEARSEGAANQKGGWLDRVDEASARVITSGTGTDFVFVSVEGVGGCGVSTPGSVGLLFRKRGAELVPLEHPIYLDLPLNAVVDFDGDGEPEMITPQGIVTHIKTRWDWAVDHSPLFLDCGC